MRPYKIFSSASICITVMLTGCVSQRDVCYSDDIAPYDTLCEGLFFAGSAARTISDKEREETYNTALVACLIRMERIKKCEAKSNILPGTIGP